MNLLLNILLSISILTGAGNTQQANISVEIRNLTSGEVIEEYRSAHVVPPASTMKLLTTAAALETLGADFRFPTVLEYSGAISDGVLHGNLYIRGSGDPSLGDRKRGQAFLSRWVKQVREAGIRRIEGAIIADMTLLDGDASNPAWLGEDAGNYYAPGIFGINYMSNTMNIILRSAAIGTTAEVLRTDPAVPDMHFINHIRCTEINYDGAFVHGMPYSHERYLTGSVPSNRGQFGVQSDLPNPGLLLAQHFTQHLNASGIEVTEPATYVAEGRLPHRTEIYTHLSDSLGALIAETNIHSNNLYAEAIFRYLGLTYGHPGTINNSANFLRDYWNRRGINMGGALIKDGCGLAPQDAISAETFVQLLTYMNKSCYRDVWMASLPISGMSGTLKSLCTGTELEGRIHAKSGTISGTKNFAGYIDMPNGDTWVFAILVNSAQGKAKNVQTVIQRYLLDVYQQHK